MKETEKCFYDKLLMAVNAAASIELDTFTVESAIGEDRKTKKAIEQCGSDYESQTGSRGQCPN